MIVVYEFERGVKEDSLKCPTNSNFHDSNDFEILILKIIMISIIKNLRERGKSIIL